MEFQALARRALQVRQQFAGWEQQRYGRAWTREEIVLGFVGDVGDLAKLALAQENVRQIPAANEKLAHELADCLWSVLVLADLYQIDLEQSFLSTMDDLGQRLQAQVGYTSTAED